MATRPAQPKRETVRFESMEEATEFHKAYYQVILSAWGPSYLKDGRAAAVKAVHLSITEQYLNGDDR